MNRQELIEKLIQKSKRKNIEAIEVYIKKSASTELNIYEGSLERHFISDEENLSLRGIYKGRMGYSYTEKFTDESIDELLENLIQYAENNENEYIESMSSENIEIEDLEDRNKLDEYSVDEKIDYLLDLEKMAYERDPSIKKISSCSYREHSESIYIKNTLGLELEDKYHGGMINLGAVAERDKAMQTGYGHLLIKDLSPSHKEELIQGSVVDAVSMLGAESINAGEYKTVLRNNVVADMFSFFSPIFSANQVQKGLSLMKGKIGKEIAIKDFNIIEDPRMENGAKYRNFDDEGTETRTKHIIKDGVLKTYLHSKKTAEKDGVQSTGNGYRSSHKSSIEVAPTNMFIQKGEKSLKELLNQIDNGVLITDIHGLHAGINPTSGDFSLSCNGFMIENGEKKSPIAQITVAGNLYDMLMEIEEIGSDMIFSHPSSNYFGSPSIIVKSLSISGK